MIDMDDLKDIFSSEENKREYLRSQAMKFLYDNQECFVAQWIIQNPFANINEYRLKFVYSDESLTGYTAEMEKIDA